MQGFNPFSHPVLGPDPTNPSIPDVFLLDQHSEGGNYSTTADLARWKQTGNVGIGHGVIQDNTRGGWQPLITGITLGHTVNWQANGGSYIPGSGWHQMFHWRGYINDVSNGSLACGFTDNAITDVHDDTVKNGVGFWTENGDGELYCFCGNGTAQTSVSSGVTLTDGKEVKLGVWVSDGDEVVFFVNSKEVHRTKTNVPTADLTPFIEIKKTDAGAAVEEIYCDTTAAVQYEQP